MLKLALIILTLGNTPANDAEVANYSVNVTESAIEWKGETVAKFHTGTVDLKEGNLEMIDGKLTGGSFEVSMASINCTDLEGEWKGKLEGHLKSDDFFGVETYPTATFVMTEAKQLDGGNYEVTGDFTVKGKTEVITFNTEVTEADGNITAVSEFTFDRAKFDVRYGSDNFFDNLGDKAIYNDIPLKITLKAARSNDI